jgi:hypothetical protein
MLLRHLKVALELEADRFNAGMRNAVREAKEFEKTLRPAQELTGLLGTAMAAAGLAVVGPMTAMAKAAANYGDELRDASLRTGAGVADLSKLRFAAEQSGSSFTELSGGLRILAKNMDAAKSGSVEQQKAFREFGVSVTDSVGRMRPMNDVMLDAADRFAQMEDGAEKAALAQQLFGRAGTALIPLLNEGSKGLKAMGDQAQRLGLVISDQAAQAADAFNDTLDQTRAATLGLANSIGAAILPSLTSLAASARDGIITFKDWTNEHQNLTKGIYGVAAAVGGSGGLLIGFSSILAVVPKVKLAMEALGVAASTLGVIAASAAAVGAVYAFRTEIATGLNDAFAGGIHQGERFVGTLQQLAGRAGFEGLSNQIGDSKFRLEEFRMGMERASEVSRRYARAIVVQGEEVSAVSAKIAKAQREAADDSAYFASISAGFAKSTGQVLAEVFGKQSEAVDKARQEFQNMLRPADELNARLGLLQNRFSSDQIVSVYAKQIADAADAQRGHGLAITGTVKELEAEAREMIRVQAAAAQLKTAIDKFVTNRRVEPIIIPPDTAQFIADLTKIPEISLQPVGISAVNKMLNDQAAARTKIIEADEKRRLQAIENERRALERATEDIKRSAGAVFDSMFLKGESVFKSLTNALKGGALSLGRAIFEDVSGALLGPVKKAFDDFMGGILGGISKKLGTVFGGLVGAGGSSGLSAIPSLAGAAPTVLPGVLTGGTSAAGGVASAAGGAASLTGSLISAAGGVVGGVISGIASARQEGTLNAIEYSTRASEIHLRGIIDKILWPMHGLTQFIANESHESNLILDAIYNKLGGGGPSAAAPVVIHDNSKFEFTFNGELTEREKDDLQARFVAALKMNKQGFLDRLNELLRSSGRAVVSA